MNDIVRPVPYLLTTDFRDNQAPGSIVPQFIRDFVVSGAAGSLNAIANMVALRAYGPYGGSDLVYLQGFRLPGDGGEGLFRWAVGSNIGDDNGTSITTSANTGAGGPNLVTNGSFSNGAQGWTVTFGTPSFTGGQVSDSTTEFWQITQTVTGLTIGTTYQVSGTYTLAAGSSTFVSIHDQFNSTPESSPTVWSTTFTATTTSITLRVGGQGAASTITGISISSAAGGRWLRVAAAEGPLLPGWFGAVGDGTTDDSAAFQSALTAANLMVVGARPGTGGTVYVPGAGKHYLLKSGLTMNPATVTFISDGADLDFSQLPSNSVALTLNGQGIFQPYVNTIHNVRGFAMTGPGTATGCAGIGFVGTNDLNSHTKFSDLSISSFQYGINFTATNVYLTTVSHCDIFNCDRCIFDSGAGNSGEMMKLEDSTFFNSVVAMDLTNSSWYVSHCSFDYNSVVAKINTVNLTVRDCHWETNVTNHTIAYPLDVQGNSALLWLGGEIYWTSLSAPEAAALINCVGSTATVILRDVQWQGWNLLSSNRLTTTTGLGNVRLEGSRFQTFGTTQAHPPLLDTTNSSLGDGSFEIGSVGTSFIDDWLISSDTVAITSRTTGTNIQLSLSNNNGNNPPAATLDPATLPANSTLSNGNLTVTSHSQYSGVRSNRSYNSNKYHFEWTINSVNGTGSTPTSIGLVTASAVLATFFYLGNNPGAGELGVPIGGNVALNGTNIGTVSTYTTGDIAVFDVDYTAQLFWFSRIRTGTQGLYNNSGTANPATGVGGLSFSALGSGKLFLGWRGITNDSATLNVGGTSFAGALPTGFIAFNSGPGGQNFQATKVGATTTAAAFKLLVPLSKINGAEKFGVGFFYSASANALGTTLVTFGYGKVATGGDANDLPIVTAIAQNTTTMTLTPTTTYQQAVQLPFLQAPNWVTHIVIQFDMKSMGAGSLFLDDVELYKF